MNSRSGESKEEPVFLQDKYSASRYNSASTGGYNNKIPALREKKVTQTQKPNSVIASAWIDQDTNTYINERRLQTRNSDGSRPSRSKVVALMLKERARDEIFAHSQSILMPIIQETMRQEFRIFENRFFKIIARIAYQIGWVLYLLRRFIAIILSGNQAVFNHIDDDSERDARIFINQRTHHLEEAESRLTLELNGQKHV